MHRTAVTCLSPLILALRFQALGTMLSCFGPSRKELLERLREATDASSKYHSDCAMQRDQLAKMQGAQHQQKLQIELQQTLISNLREKGEEEAARSKEAIGKLQGELATLQQGSARLRQHVAALERDRFELLAEAAKFKSQLADKASLCDERETKLTQQEASSRKAQHEAQQREEALRNKLTQREREAASMRKQFQQTLRERDRWQKQATHLQQVCWLAWERGNAVRRYLAQTARLSTSRNC